MILSPDSAALALPRSAPAGSHSREALARCRRRLWVGGETQKCEEMRREALGWRPRRRSCRCSLLVPRWPLSLPYTPRGLYASVDLLHFLSASVCQIGVGCYREG
ncbi:hypothetical protein ACQJBY_004324 [Aegilops geniculata]